MPIQPSRLIAAAAFACTTAITASCASKYAGEPNVRIEPVAGPERLAASASPAGGPATAPATRAVTVPSPWMFREASLPAGFPAVGPVDEVIVKRYPAYRAARVTAADAAGTKGAGAKDGGEKNPAAADAKASDGSMFRMLFDHIKRNDIEMTAPVEMTYAADGDRPVDMAFLYGQPTWGQPGADGNVRVADLPPVTVVSVTVRGSYSAKTVAETVGKLRAYVAARPTEWEVAGPPRLLGYNSPFVPWFLRVSEVQLPVRAKGAEGK
ncbi:MAG TPA: heme-binding protein [Humisphaera sp.]